MSGRLMMHAGGYVATRDQVAAVVTPPVNQETGWTPIPHVEVMDRTVGELTRAGYRVTREQLGLWGPAGERFFAAFDLDVTVAGGTTALVVGLRNAHDRSYAAGIALGQAVFICDNRAFSAEITFGRKHTRFINRDLPGLITSRLALLPTFAARAEKRIAGLQNTEVGNLQVHDLLIRAYDNRVISGGAIKDVLQEYRNARHPEFKPRTLWSLHNAFTEVLKNIQPVDLPRRTRSLDVLLDAAVDAEYTVEPWDAEADAEALDVATVGAF